MNLTLDQLRERRREIIDRMLTIGAALSESKRAWLVEKGGMSFPERTALEAEAADLRLQRHRISVEIHDAERAEKLAITPLAESLRIAGLTLIGLAEHDQRCDVFDLDDEGKHCACTCGLAGAIDVITQAGKTAVAA